MRMRSTVTFAIHGLTDAHRPRRRRRHHRCAHGRRRLVRTRGPRSRTASFRSTFPAPDGSSTTRSTSGAPRTTRSSTWSRSSTRPACPRVTSPRSGSPTSARRSSRGTARRDDRCTEPWCGRTAAPAPAARSSVLPATSRWCAPAPASCSTRTSPRPSSSGCSREGGVDPGPDLAVGTVDSWILWNLTGGSDRTGAGHVDRGGAVHATEPSNARRHDVVRHRHAGVVRRAV